MQSHSDFIQRLEKGQNGRFVIEGRDGRCFVRIVPSGQNGEPVRLADVRSRLDFLCVKNYSESRLSEIVSGADGKEHDLCAWDHPVPVDAEVLVVVSDDGMRAQTEFRPPKHGGALLSEDKVLNALKEAGVIYGINLNNIRAGLEESLLAWSKPKMGEGGSGGASTSSSSSFIPHRKTIYVDAAEGEMPVSGDRGSILHHFNPHPRAQPKIDSDMTGRVDFREINVIQSCEVNVILAERVSAKPGIDGKTVLGGVLPSPVSQEVELLAGKNTRLSEDGSRLYSTIAGQVKISETKRSGGAKIDVVEILDLPEVDYSVGNVDFPGTVVVRGTVLDGFRIIAEGDIVIQKSIGNVQLSAKGDIVLSGGVAGRGSASIQAKGDIYARFVENASVYSKRSIYIEEAAMHARLFADMDIRIEGGRGELMGGFSLAGLHLRAMRIGTRNETKTVVQAGLDPDAAEELRRLEAEFQEKNGVYAKVLLHISQIEEAKKRGRVFEENQDATLEKLFILRGEYGEALENLEAQRELLYEKMQPQEGAMVEAVSGVYPGVEVRFGAGIKAYTVSPRAVFNYCRFIADNGSVVMRHSAL